LRPPLPARGCRADLTTSPSGHDAETPVEKPGRPADHSCPPTAHRSRIDPERRSSPPTQFLGGSRFSEDGLVLLADFGWEVGAGAVHDDGGGAQGAQLLDQVLD